MTDRDAEALKAAEVLRTARDFAYDDYLAALLAPKASRGDLLTLAAAFGELARIPLQVSDATLGEIRLQWWRDALAGGTRSGHAVADALTDLGRRLSRHGGPSLPETFAPAIDARAAELYSEPFADAQAFDACMTAPARAHLVLRAAVLGVPADALPMEAARTLGLVRACVRLPLLFAKGRCPIDAARLGGETGPDAVPDLAALSRAMADLVAEADAAWRSLRPELQRINRDQRLVLLPLALSGPYLRVLQGVGHDLVRQVADPSPLERSVRLWLAARLGRF